MKVRLRDNSIRIRISKNELDTLGKGSEIHSKSMFPNGSLNFRICICENDENISFIGRDNSTEILLYVHQDRINEMMETESVGFSRSFIIDNGTDLKLTFEKDYKCLSPRDENESDLFNHPDENHINC